jgi:hypothetical protein
MADDFPLSQHLQSYIDTLDWEEKRDIPPEEREEAKKAEKVVKLIVDDIIASRESMLENRLAVIEKFVVAEPELVKHFLDERFTRDVIDAVPGYVSRTMQLSRLESSRTPSKTTNSYLREAVRAYIFGFPQASIALSRATLEQALKEELGHQGGKIFVDMNNLLDEAQGGGMIDGVIRKTARKLATEADAVLHERPADLPKAYDILLMLRGVLQHIYAD